MATKRSIPILTAWSSAFLNTGTSSLTASLICCARYATALLVLALTFAFSGRIFPADQTDQRALDPAIDRRVEDLIDVFRHPNARDTNLEQTRKATAELVRIGTAAVPQLALAILSGQDAVPVYSALALDRIGNPAVSPVRKLWPSLDDQSRWKLMRFRGKHDYKAALTFAITSLKSADETIRWQAIGYCEKHAESKARDQLLKMLNTDTPSLRWRVVSALTAIGGDEVGHAFIGLLAPDSWAARGEGLEFDVLPHWGCDGRPTIIEALQKLNHRAAAPAILQVLSERGKGKAYLARFAIPALAALRYEEAVPELERIVTADPASFERSAGATPEVIHAMARDGIRRFRQ